MNSINQNLQNESRRNFLKLSLGVALSTTGSISLLPSASAANLTTLNAYVMVSADGKITIYSPNPEVGQGVNTSLPMIVAEELDADWDDVICKASPVGKEYGSQFAGGSLSVPMRWDELRKVGATARELLMRAAAQEWQVPRNELSTEASMVKHTPSGRSAKYADLVERAASLPLPAEDEVTLKLANEYRLLGQRVVNASAEAIATGQQVFGIDASHPDMVYANYIKCPNLGGVPKTANLNAIKKLPGVIDAFMVEGTPGPLRSDKRERWEIQPGIALITKDTWSAFKARQSLEVEWDTTLASTDNSDQIEREALAALVSGKSSKELDRQGDVDAAFETAAVTADATYHTDFVSHAQLEPQGVLVHVRGNEVEIWTSSQTTGSLRGRVAKLLKIDEEAVTIHQLRGGGGFGRRLTNEYVYEAATISRQIGKPVKLQWSREDDMAFDYFRAPTYYRLQAAVSEAGELTGWKNHIASCSADGESANYGAGYIPYDFPGKVLPNVLIEQSFVASKTTTGAWRAPISNVYAFAEQSFIAELANSAGVDHRDFLLSALGNKGWIEDGNYRTLNVDRAKATIEAVTKAAGWGRELPEGRGLGLAFFFSHAGHIAEVAEVSVEGKNVRIHDVWVAADIGQVINMSGLENQLQGSVVDGVSTMAAQRITIVDGAVEQSNFDSYPLLRMPQSPKVHVEVLDSGYRPTGAGEPGLPPLAPAVCNAIFNACGERIRALPISRAGFTVV